MSQTLTQELLRVEDATAGYGAGSRSARVLRGISLTVKPGRTLGIVGESGSGKSTLARVMAGQLRPSGGRVFLAGRDLGSLRGQDLRRARRQIQLIPQDHYSSLDPHMTIGATLAEAINPRKSAWRPDRARVSELLETVALDADAASRLPHEFSGGQRQRIAIARALAVQPQLIIADEITSAIDSSMQAEILNLLVRLQNDRNLGYVVVTHDLSIAQYMCDEIAVLYLGRIAEHGTTELLASPAHPYTELLLQSIPDATGRMLTELPLTVESEPGDAASPPAGCPFHPRCPYGPEAVSSHMICATSLPPLQPSAEASRIYAACHFPLSHAAAEQC